MPVLRVHLFGSLEVTLAESPAPLRFPTRKAELLFCYLLLNPEGFHSREQLASLWWGNQETRKARHCLNTTLWRLREALASKAAGQTPFLITEPNTIGINPDARYWLDVHEFARLCLQARQLDSAGSEAAGDVLRRAVALYRGDLLPDCYDEWCLLQRQQLHHQYLAALNRLAEFCARRQDFQAAIDCYYHILAGDPLREEIHRALMRLYLVAGRPQAALQQFHACSELLQRELGVDPMAETIALYVQLQTHTPAARSKRLADEPGGWMFRNSDASALRSALGELSSAAGNLAAAIVGIQQALQHLERLMARPEADG